MAQNTGTLVTAAIRPNDSLDLIASAFANEVKGGNHGYATLAERDSIIEQRREWGMFCTVYDDGANNGTYILTKDESSGTITDNGNWIVFVGNDGVLEPPAIILPPSTPVVTGNKEVLDAIVATVNGSEAIATGITIVPNDDVYPTVEINNDELTVGDGVTTLQCYFADPATPTQARGFSPTSPNGKIALGDKLYVNPSLIGYTLDTEDTITIKF